MTTAEIHDSILPPLSHADNGKSTVVKMTDGTWHSYPGTKKVCVDGDNLVIDHAKGRATFRIHFVTMWDAPEVIE